MKRSPRNDLTGMPHMFGEINIYHLQSSDSCKSLQQLQDSKLLYTFQLCMVWGLSFSNGECFHVGRK